MKNDERKFKTGDRVIIDRAALERDVAEAEKAGIFTGYTQEDASTGRFLDSLPGVYYSVVIGYEEDGRVTVDSSHVGNSEGIFSHPEEWLMIAPEENA